MRASIGAALLLVAYGVWIVGAFAVLVCFAAGAEAALDRYGLAWWQGLLIAAGVYVVPLALLAVAGKVSRDHDVS